jgi:hypothetical protein
MIQTCALILNIAHCNQYCFFNLAIAAQCGQKMQYCFDIIIVGKTTVKLSLKDTVEKQYRYQQAWFWSKHELKLLLLHMGLT